MPRLDYPWWGEALFWNKKGETHEQIAKRFGVSKQMVQIALNKVRSGYKQKYKPILRKGTDIVEAYFMFPDWPVEMLAKGLDISVEEVTKELDRRGLPYRGKAT